MGLAGCGNPNAPIEITETRTALPPTPTPRPPAMPPAPTATLPQEAPPVTWVAPAGWVQIPPTAIRLVNFKVGPPPEAECYVSVLKGSGGGTELNINRWRGQMGLEQEPLSTEAIATLPKIAVLGRETPLLEAAGAYRGMSDESKAGYLLLGTICEREKDSVFVKMVGPEAAVRAQRDNFIAFCQSLKPGAAQAQE
jgi:hypothetical protein